jgi:hypothetical protein
LIFYHTDLTVLIVFEIIGITTWQTCLQDKPIKLQVLTGPRKSVIQLLYDN